jgi:hypothetical protein
VDVTGGIRLTDGAVGALAGTGSVAANLATGQALLSGTQRGTAALAPPPVPGQSFLTVPPESLQDAGFRGTLNISQTGLSGAVRGTGILTVQPPAGPDVPAATTFTAAPPPVSAAASADARAARLALVTALAEGAGPLPARQATIADTGGGATGTYTLSNAVYGFLADTLRVPLAGPAVTGTLSGHTLTVTVGPLGQLPLADGVATPSFGPATIAIDTAGKTLALTAALVSGPASGTLRLSIGGLGRASLSAADVSGSLTLSGLPFFGGATTSLTGALGYSGGTLTVTLSGATDTAATFDGGDVRIEQGAAVSLAKGGPFTVSGTASIGPPDNSFGVHVQGSLSGLRTWSLNVSDAHLPAWTPVPDLTVTPDFAGTIADTAGTIRFTLSAGDSTAGNGGASGTDAGARPLSWAPDGSDGPQLVLSSLVVSNAAPPGAYHCGKVGAAGQVWIGATGALGYAPLRLAGPVQLTASACVDVGDRHFTITTATVGTPGGDVFGTRPFSVSELGLTASYDGTRFLLTGTARLTVTAPTTFTVTLDLAFGSGGTIIAAARVAAPAVSAGAGSVAPAAGGQQGFVYLSSTAEQVFDPGDFGLTGPAFPSSVPLQRGVTVAYEGDIPSQITKDFGDIGVSPSSWPAVFVAASLSGSGVSLDMAADFGQPPGGLLVLSSNGTGLYFNDADFGMTITPDIADTTFRLSGDAYLVMSKLNSSVRLSLGGSLSAAGDVAFDLALRDWDQNAFGVSGLRVGTLAITAGFDVADEEPTFAISADDITFPSSWDNAIGLADGAVITIDANFDAAEPLVNFSIDPPSPGSGQPVLYPLAVAYGGVEQAMATNPQALNSILVYQANFYIAPEGGSTAAGTRLNRGLDVTFQAAIAGHGVFVAGAVSTLPPSIAVNVSADPVTLGQLSLGATSFYLMAGPQDDPKISLGFTGSVTVGPADGSPTYYSLSANLHLAVGSTTVNDGTIDLAVTTGLPSFLQIQGELSGYVAESGGQVSFAAQGSGNFTLTLPFYPYTSESLGGVSFDLNQGANSFDWGTQDGVSAIVSFFAAAPADFNTTVAILKHLGLNAFQILNALGAGGVDSGQILTDLETGFGAFSLTYYDIWVDPSWEDLFAFPVIAVADASDQPGHRVIDWRWTDGYEQDWKFVTAPIPGSYEIVNRNSGQCLTVPGGPGSQFAATPGVGVTQGPCASYTTQYWYLGDGSPQLAKHFTIQNVNSGQYLDIQGGSPDFGTIVDQWTYNGGMNQYFWLTNSGNT